MTAAAKPSGHAGVVAGDLLDGFCRAVLLATGADAATADAATRAMMHASRLGVDSHGIRLIDHYVRALEGGRINRRPNVQVVSGLGAVAALDADDGHGALGAYRAMEHAVALAEQHGVGAVSVRNTRWPKQAWMKPAAQAAAT